MQIRDAAKRNPTALLRTLSQSHSPLRNFLHTLEAAGELIEVPCSVDSHLELAEIHRRIVQQRGPALLFSNVKGSSYPVVTNLFGSDRRVQLALGEKIESRIEELLSFFLDHKSRGLRKLWNHRNGLAALWRLGTNRIRKSPFRLSAAPDLNTIPFLTCWPADGGAYLTLPLVYTQSPVDGCPNLGMYRIQRHSCSETGVHWQVGKGGSFHYQQAEQMNQPLPLTVYLGASPALLFSAIAPLPERLSELIFASLLEGNRVGYLEHPKTPLPLFVDCEMALCGSVQPFVRRAEGPFGDHFGYEDPARPFPVFTVHHVFSRPDAIIPATVTGKPLQEDATLGKWVQQLLKPFLLAAIPGIEDIHSFAETGFHPLVAIRVKERYNHEAFNLALRILSEGQLSFTKTLFVVDSPLPLNDITALLPYILERLSPQTLFILPNTINDSLDMTGPAVDSGSKAILFGIGPPKRRLPHVPPVHPPCATAKVFVPGCLVVDSLAPGEEPATFIQHDRFSSWPLVVLVDDATKATSSPLEFLWTLFTRFEPARDIYAKERNASRNGLLLSLPLLIDARMKPSYYPEVKASEGTLDLVTRRWHEYFPA